VGNHEPTFAPVVKQGRPMWFVRCKCNTPAATFQHRWEAEDWWTKHQEEIEKVKAALAPKNTTLATLKVQRDHFVKMSEDPGQSEGDRLLWKALADELTTRIDDRTERHEGQETLF
jgi:hypothetical protein